MKCIKNERKITHYEKSWSPNEDGEKYKGTCIRLCYGEVFDLGCSIQWSQLIIHWWDSRLDVKTSTHKFKVSSIKSYDKTKDPNERLDIINNQYWTMESSMECRIS